MKWVVLTVLIGISNLCLAQGIESKQTNKTGVVAGAYSSADITVDGYGNVTKAANGGSNNSGNTTLIGLSNQQNMNLINARCIWSRVGNIVSFSYIVNCEFGAFYSSGELDLPVTSNFTIGNDLLGTITATRIPHQGNQSNAILGDIEAQITNDRLKFQLWTGGGNGTSIIAITGHYIVK